MSAGALGVFAALRGRTHHTFFLQLQCLVREVDDTRALTWNSDLSDTLGRCQQQLLKLTEEWGAAARQEIGIAGHANSFRRALPAAHKLDKGVAPLN